VAAERVMLGDAPGEALASERAEFDLGHVEPGAVLGRVVDLKPVGQALGFGWRERLVEGGGRVGVELAETRSVCGWGP